MTTNESCNEICVYQTTAEPFFVGPRYQKGFLVGFIAIKRSRNNLVGYLSKFSSCTHFSDSLEWQFKLIHFYINKHRHSHSVVAITNKNNLLTSTAFPMLGALGNMANPGTKKTAIHLAKRPLPGLKY